MLGGEGSHRLGVWHEWWDLCVAYCGGYVGCGSSTVHVVTLYVASIVHCGNMPETPKLVVCPLDKEWVSLDKGHIHCQLAGRRACAGIMSGIMTGGHK